MKILLIQPPFTILRTEEKKCHPPLGLAYLASSLKGLHEVSVLDALASGYETSTLLSGRHMRYGLGLPEILREITAAKPDVVAVSCLFSSQAANAHKVCEIAKEADPAIITILGGAHPSSLPETTLSDKHVDVIIIGEGEVTLKNLLCSLEKSARLDDINGIGFKKSGAICINPQGKDKINPDSLLFPAWELFPLEKYYEINNPHGSPARRTPFLPVITSRGCPFECIFCSVHTIWGKEYRMRSCENVIAEIRHLREKFAVREILFEDDNLTLDRNRSKGIFNAIISNKFDISWSVPNGIAAQTLDDELLGLMKKSGCYRISLGVESGDEDILRKIIKKPIVLSQVKGVVKKASELGMETAAFFVVGLPGESRRQLRRTFEFAWELGAQNNNFFFATPLPGTQLQKLCRELKLLPGEIDFLDLKSDSPVFSNGELSRNELRNIVMRYKTKLMLLGIIKTPKLFIAKAFRKLRNDPGYFNRFWRQFHS